MLCAGLIGFRSLRMAEDARHIGFYGIGASAHLLIQIARAQDRRLRWGCSLFWGRSTRPSHRQDRLPTGGQAVETETEVAGSGLDKSLNEANPRRCAPR